MIVISLVLFLLGVGLLAAGLVVESIELELFAVVSALLSALALYFAVRNRRPAAGQDEPVDPRKALLSEPISGLNADEIWSPPPIDHSWPGRTTAAQAQADREHPKSGAETSVADEGVVKTPVLEGPGPVAPDSMWGDDDAHGAARTDFDAREESGESRQEAEQAGDQEAAEEISLHDEPDEEDVSEANVARVATRSDEVMVIDGRPRYHRQACSALAGQETVPIPVSEARASGFSPCARCRPDAYLLGNVQRPMRR